MEELKNYQIALQKGAVEFFDIIEISLIEQGT